MRLLVTSGEGWCPSEQQAALIGRQCRLVGGALEPTSTVLAVQTSWGRTGGATKSERAKGLGGGRAANQWRPRTPSSQLNFERHPWEYPSPLRPREPRKKTVRVGVRTARTFRGDPCCKMHSPEARPSMSTYKKNGSLSALCEGGGGLAALLSPFSQTEVGKWARGMCWEIPASFNQLPGLLWANRNREIG